MLKKKRNEKEEKIIWNFFFLVLISHFNREFFCDLNPESAKCEVIRKAELSSRYDAFTLAFSVHALMTIKWSVAHRIIKYLLYNNKKERRSILVLWLAIDFQTTNLRWICSKVNNEESIDLINPARIPSSSEIFVWKPKKEEERPGKSNLEHRCFLHCLTRCKRTLMSASDGRYNPR